ncbi:hypothetical protein J6A34_03010 [bacterium]|nr:hypothetical protein [bacterium]
MKIDKIAPQMLAQNKVQNVQQPQVAQNEEVKQNLAIPSAQHYIGYQPNFTGGYSLDLAETVANLDKLAAKYPNIYPKNVREWAGLILEEGNKAKDTLITIHRRLYESIKDCFSLAELKAKFPEFKDVKSAYDVDYREGTLMDDLISGRIPEFNTEEDLTLQLIKLYWADGFSLNDLKAYAGGRDLNPIMNKLGIPKVDRNYGHVLKFSDPEYNERLTTQMKLKRMETMDIKAQQQEGEPVYIPQRRDGRPLSAEHRKHIQEGLLKFYREHPERAFAMSERQKQFFREHPEQAEMFHRVMVKAWHMASADNIRKAMSKFMKANKVQDFSVDELTSPHKMTKERSALMKKFWADNPWANKTFSNNMKHAWKKVKEEQDMFYIVDMTPVSFQRKFFAWCDKMGIDKTNLDFQCFKFYPHHPELNMEPAGAKLLNSLTPKFIDSCEGDESQKLANTMQMTLIRFGHYLKTFEKSPHATAETKDLAFMIRRVIHHGLFDTQNTIKGIPSPRVLDAMQVQGIYTTIMTEMMSQHENKMIKELVKYLNDSYDHLDRSWKAGEPLILSPTAHLF